MVNCDEYTLYLTGEIDQHSTEQVLRKMHEPGSTLTIYLNTEGGDTHQMMEICNLIENTYKEVTVHGVGMVCSAGIWILNSAKHRVATPDCLLLIHHGEETTETPADKRRYNKMFKCMKQMLIDKVSVSPSTVGRWFSKETYMSAQEALKAGLIDEIRSAAPR